MRKTLEGSKLFPYLAWAVFILFAIFTYFLAEELQKSASYLGERTELNVSALNET